MRRKRWTFERNKGLFSENMASKSEIEGERDLSWRGKCHTSRTIVFGILAVQTLVGVEEQRVGDVEAQRGRREGQALEVCRRKRVGHGHILQANETAVGHHLLRIVVGVVGALDVFASHLVDQRL